MSAPVFKKNKVEQTIELDEVFGVDFSGMRSLREAIGEAILERIRQRTLAGNGLRFAGDRGVPTKLKSPYSKAYAESLDFKAFGKTRSNVNMKLTGDMLGLMDIKKQSGNSITIGWNDATENAKAYNHSVGDTVPSRPFFGVSKTELKEIKRDFKAEIQAAIMAKKEGSIKEFDSKVSALLDLLKDSNSPVGTEDV